MCARGHGGELCRVCTNCRCRSPLKERGSWSSHITSPGSRGKSCVPVPLQVRAEPTTPPLAELDWPESRKRNLHSALL
ncbi:hypothetical protein CapIbe_006780 [Capra ibex]